MADEILPPVISCARYSLAAHACHSPYPLAASRRFTNVHRCRLSPASSRIFLCLVSCASRHLRQDRAVPLKHANPSCIKFSLLRRARRLPHFVMLVCCEPSSPYFATAPATHTYRARASFSGRALKFQSKIPIWRCALAETISLLVRRRGLNFASRRRAP